MTRWRLLLEEYHLKVVHISGVHNNVADTLSRLDISDKTNDARFWGEKSKHLEYINVHMMNIGIFLSEDGFDDDAVMALAKEEDTSY